MSCLIMMFYNVANIKEFLFLNPYGLFLICLSYFDSFLFIDSDMVQ